MNILGRLFAGLLTALFSLLLVTGATSLALSEGLSFTVAVPAITARATSAPALVTAQSTPVSAATAQPSATIFVATTCPIPMGWHEVVLKSGDTLDNLAAGYGLSPQTIAEANCLLVDQLLVGSIIFLPLAAPTLAPAPPPTAIPCGPPYDWVRYIVQPGDTLFKLSLDLRVSVIQLQYANCMGSSTLIRAGDVLYTPFFPPPRPPYPGPPPPWFTTSPVTATTPGSPTDEPDVVTDVPTDEPPTEEPTEEETVPPDDSEPTEVTEPPIETEPPDVVDPPEETEPPVDP